MKNALFRLVSFLRYYWEALTRYQLHSPLAFAFVTEVLESSAVSPYFAQIEAQRNKMRGNRTTHQHIDYGTGQSMPLLLGDIVQRAASGRRQGQLLFNLTQWRGATHILEMGSSLGIGSAYLAAGMSAGQMISLEGCPICAAHARKWIHDLQLKHWQVREGDFAQTLQPALEALGSVDLVYFDGNHRAEPTLAYFEQCLPFASNDSVFVFDDIYWSADMATAWATIIGHPRVRMSIDCYELGLVFFDAGIRQKRHFKTIHSSWKPLKIF